MAPEKKLVGKDILKQLVPFNMFSEDHLDEISHTTFVEFMPPNSKLFKKGQRDKYRYYLLRGMIVMEGGDNGPLIVKGGTKEARYPLSTTQPHSATAVAKSDIAYMRVDEDKIETMMPDQGGGYSVDDMGDHEESSDDDWMTKVLQSKSFQKLPATNIQALFMRLQSMPTKKGEVIIKQGEPGEHYYIVSRGKCEVIVTDPQGQSRKVAELEVGDSFGEEALLAETKRNATVRMVSEGAMMRLSREDFEELLKQPLLKSVTLDEAKAMLKQGTILIDVRMEKEYQEGSIRGSKNIPLHALRKVAHKMPADKKYITCCDNGHRSRSAAFLLSERGYEVYVLEGGLQSIEAGKASSG